MGKTCIQNSVNMYWVYILKLLRNIACVGELGRFPIYVAFSNNILNYVYYFYVCQKSEDSLVGQTLLVSKKLHQSGDKSWFSGVNTILKEINVDETNCNQA